METTPPSKSPTGVPIDHTTLLTGPAPLTNPDALLLVESYFVAIHTPILLFRLKGLAARCVWNHPNTDSKIPKDSRQRRKRALKFFPNSALKWVDLTGLLSPDALHQALLFAYGGRMKLQTLDPIKVVQLLAFVDHTDHDLLEQCMAWLFELLTKDNISDCLAFCRTCDSHHGKYVCESFILQNQLLLNKDISSQIGFELYQELTHVALGQPKFYSPPESFPNSIALDFKAFLQSAPETGDVGFCFRDVTVKAHRIMLSYQAPTFDNIFPERNQDTYRIPSCYRTLTSNSFQSLLRYLYYRDLGFTLSEACTLYSFVQDLNLFGLEIYFQQMMTSAPVSEFDANEMIFIAPKLISGSNIPASLKHKAFTVLLHNFGSLHLNVMESQYPGLALNFLTFIQENQTAAREARKAEAERKLSLPREISSEHRSSPKQTRESRSGSARLSKSPRQSSSDQAKQQSKQVGQPHDKPLPIPGRNGKMKPENRAFN